MKNYFSNIEKAPLQKIQNNACKMAFSNERELFSK